MVSIKVRDLDFPGDDPVYVRSVPEGVVPPTCQCMIDVIDPARPVNVPIEWDLKIDRVCGQLVPWEKNDAYNQHFGFSGYDEYHDDEPREEDDCE